ncbi:MAG: DNA translocase FtsK [Actinobacteria bacterium]|nr:DNA translocase FtsK [Actinomycetota bacterium]
MAGKKIKSKKNNKKKTSEINVYRDIVALSLTAFSIFILLALLKPEAAGIAGKIVSSGLRYLFGIGSYFLPAIFFFYALSILISSNTGLRLLTYGLSISFVSFLALISLIKINGEFFKIEKAREAGGITGSLLAYPLVTLFGENGAYLIIFTSFIVSIVIILNKPVSELIEGLRKTSETSREPTKTQKAPLLDSFSRKRDRTIKIERPEVTQPIEFVQESDNEIHESEEQVSEKIERTGKTSSGYEFPPLSLLNKKSGQLAETVGDFKRVIETTLEEFNIPARVVGTQEGPTVTTFEVQLEPGTPVRKLTSLQDDISIALATPNVRIITPLPGKSAIGIEVPNKLRELVTLRELLDTDEWKSSKDPLLIAVGKSSSGIPYYYSLRKMPHMLIAGATGSGKSVCLNSIILTILFKAHPDDVKLLLIDPKRVEFSPYKDIPHLLAPVVVDPNKAASALAYMVQEMERRYQALSSMVARDIESYNRKAAKEGAEKLPYIIVIIDELADLMLVCSREVEESIVRLAQMARAVGIHLIVATQRPSADIITGLIKSNITTRIAFSVRSQIDSRVILDAVGAEKLIGQGDMLFLAQSLLHPVRLQAPYVSEEEIEKVTNFVKSQAKPDYKEEVFSVKLDKAKDSEVDDELYDEAVETILTYGQASTSFLQRKLKIGYARAARIMDMLEASGIVGSQEGSKPREILITREEWEARKRRAQE